MNQPPDNVHHKKTELYGVQGIFIVFRCIVQCTIILFFELLQNYGCVVVLAGELSMVIVMIRALEWINRRN